MKSHEKNVAFLLQIIFKKFFNKSKHSHKQNLSSNKIITQDEDGSYHDWVENRKNNPTCFYSPISFPF